MSSLRRFIAIGEACVKVNDLECWFFSAVVVDGKPEFIAMMAPSWLREALIELEHGLTLLSLR